MGAENQGRGGGGRVPGSGGPRDNRYPRASFPVGNKDGTLFLGFPQVVPRGGLRWARVVATPGGDGDDRVMDHAAEIAEAAREVGFDLFGIAPLRPPKDAERFREWLRSGRHAGLDYLAADAERILDPRGL